MNQIHLRSIKLIIMKRVSNKKESSILVCGAHRKINRVKDNIVQCNYMIIDHFKGVFLTKEGELLSANIEDCLDKHPVLG